MDEFELLDLGMLTQFDSVSSLSDMLTKAEGSR